MFNHVGCKLVQVGTKRIEPKLLELSQQGPLIWKPLMDVVGCSVFTSAGCIKGFIHILRKVIFPDDSKVVVTHRLPLFISFLKGAYKQAPGGLTPDWTLSKTTGGVITDKVASLYAQACKTSVVHQPTPPRGTTSTSKTPKQNPGSIPNTKHFFSNRPQHDRTRFR